MIENTEYSWDSIGILKSLALWDRQGILRVQRNTKESQAATDVLVLSRLLGNYF